MSLKLDHPSDFPRDAFRALLKANSAQQELLKLYMECSDEVQSVVRSMFAVLESADVTEEDRHRAVATIADALYLNPQAGHGSYGFDLAKMERQTASEHPEEHRRWGIAKRLSQMDAQEATFAERLRQILEQKNITQDDLAQRIGCSQSAISKMLTRNSRPHQKTIYKMATALAVAPTDLWPDLEVAAILDSIAQFPQDRDLDESQVKAIESASSQPPVKIDVHDLPSRKRK